MSIFRVPPYCCGPAGAGVVGAGAAVVGAAGLVGAAGAGADVVVGAAGLAGVAGVVGAGLLQPMMRAHNNSAIRMTINFFIFP